MVPFPTNLLDKVFIYTCPWFVTYHNDHKNQNVFGVSPENTPLTEVGRMGESVDKKGQAHCLQKHGGLKVNPKIKSHKYVFYHRLSRLRFQTSVHYRVVLVNIFQKNSFFFNTIIQQV